MATITYADLRALLNEPTLPTTDAEQIIDLAVDCLNLYGADLPNMTGTAGAKTLSLESREKGAVFMSARAIFFGFYKGITNVSVQNISVSQPDVIGNATVMRVISEAGRLLSEVDVAVG